MFHLLKKLVGNQYVKVHRILVPLAISPKNMRGTAYGQLINVRDPIHRNEFDNYDRVTMSIFPQELAQNQYITLFRMLLISNIRYSEQNFKSLEFTLRNSYNLCCLFRTPLFRTFRYFERFFRLPGMSTIL